MRPPSRVPGAVDSDQALVDARRALRRAIRDIERARTPSRKETPDALTTLSGELTPAHWHLVDHFESDGARYVVARESASLASLTPAEACVVDHARRGRSTKEIAYTMGINAATVRVLIMRAARRCGVGSRKELLNLRQATSSASYS